MTIGFIGLGSLGTPIAENILERTGQLYVYNRTASKAQPLLARGAIVCPSVKELASRCDIVFSVVLDDAALNAITEGADGLAANLKRNGIHVSVSTILPATAARLEVLHRQHNNHYIAAPVLGRPEAARARKLNFLVSGNPAPIQAAKQVLEDAGAAQVWEIGDDIQAANTMKLCTNFLLIAAIEAIAESISLARKSGVNAQLLMDILTQTIFNSSIYSGYSKTILAQTFIPAGFALKAGLKDINLVLEQARTAHAKLHTAELLQEQLQKAIAEGFAEHDTAALALVLNK